MGIRRTAHKTKKTENPSEHPAHSSTVLPERVCKLLPHGGAEALWAQYFHVFAEGQDFHAQLFGIAEEEFDLQPVGVVFEDSLGSVPGQGLDVLSGNGRESEVNFFGFAGYRGDADAVLEVALVVEGLVALEEFVSDFHLTFDAVQSENDHGFAFGVFADDVPAVAVFL